MSVLHVLTKGLSYDQVDDGARMGEETVRKYAEAFLSDVREKCGLVYLNRRPSGEELATIE